MKKQITCCIADDSLFFRKIMLDICSELGLLVLKEYENGDSLFEELQLEQTTQPDLIFLDINMPGRSGKVLLDLLLDCNPEFVIIIISSIGDIQEIKECLELGAANYINKDASKHAMKEIIAATIKSNGILD